MWVADMDFQSPPAVLAALREHIDHGVFGYAHPTEELVAVIIDMLRKRYHWSIKPQWLVWLPGLVTGLNIACRTVGDSGAEVATFTPIYPPFLSAPRWSERKLVTVPLVLQENRWQMDFEKFEKSLSPDTRLMLLCNPHNPVGRVFEPDDIKKICNMCLKKNMTICSDEIHCDLILDDIEHTPTATLSEEIADNSITLMAPSKTYNLPGLGCSFAVIPNEQLRKQFLKVKRGIVPHVNALGYTACLAAYRDSELWHQELLSYLRHNRDLVEQFIQTECRPLKMAHVEATYLAWIDISALNLDDPESFFESHGVGLSGGHWFQGNGFVRLNFGCPRKLLQEGLERMKKAIRSL